MQVLKILPTFLFEEFENTIGADLQSHFNQLEEAEISSENFSFYTSVASVYSSKIEGEEIELDSYIKHKKFGVEFLPDYTKKTDDLYNAYSFAKSAKFNQQNIQEAHRVLSKHLLSKTQQGSLRSNMMYVSTPDGRIEYVAVSPLDLRVEMQKFYDDITTLVDKELTFSECFFYASLIHLVFVKIHPFNDGNGRTARLLEKWFLAEKLGEKAWFIESEKSYYQNHKLYYQNLRSLGLEYQELNYRKSMSFLMMLANSIVKKKEC